MKKIIFGLMLLIVFMLSAGYASALFTCDGNPPGCPPGYFCSPGTGIRYCEPVSEVSTTTTTITSSTTTTSTTTTSTVTSTTAGNSIPEFQDFTAYAAIILIVAVCFILIKKNNSA